MKIGDVVVSVEGPNSRALCCGPRTYTHAICVSVEPLIVVSEDGSMLWRYLDRNELVALCQASPEASRIAFEKFEKNKDRIGLLRSPVHLNIITEYQQGFDDGFKRAIDIARIEASPLTSSEPLPADRCVCPNGSHSFDCYRRRIDLLTDRHSLDQAALAAANETIAVLQERSAQMNAELNQAADQCADYAKQIRELRTGQPPGDTHIPIAAASKACEFLLDEYVKTACDSTGCTDCVRCNTVAVARWLLKTLGASPTATPQPPQAARVVALESALQGILNGDRDRHGLTIAQDIARSALAALRAPPAEQGQAGVNEGSSA